MSARISSSGFFAPELLKHILFLVSRSLPRMEMGGDGISPRNSVDFCQSDFTLTEIMEMENIMKISRGNLASKDFCRDLAHNFSSSHYRLGKSTIKWKQVQSWFEDRKKELQAKANSQKSVLKLDVIPFSYGTTTSSNASESSSKLKGENVDLSELSYEAKSVKDGAWYDVASFLNYRVLSTGELEVRVRYAGFHKEEDEWVSVKSGVRERSIPLLHSECQRVRVGDLVLCFKESPDHAVYRDAHVLTIQRRLHDIRGCRCIFVVRYDHNNSEEIVGLERLCCRPSNGDQTEH